MTALTLRPAVPGDAAAAARVMTASIRDLCSADHRNDPEAIARWCASKTPDSVAAMIAEPGNLLVIAERESAVVAVGAIEWKDLPAGTGKITLLYVAPEAQGRGVSRTLLADLEARLAARGLSQGILTATATARAFYLAQGWQPDGPPRPGRWIVGHPMRKTLPIRDPSPIPLD